MSTATDLQPWRALHWEPVAGTGERLMVGVVYCHNGEFAVQRVIRDDALDCMYGESVSAAKRIIDHGLALYLAAAKAANSIEPLGFSAAGLHASPLHATATVSVAELLRVACLQYSSMANLDKIDDADESDRSTANEEATRRFSTDIREAFLSRQPTFKDFFGRSTELIQGGNVVKFGYASTRVLAHFSVLRPMQHVSSMRDARGRLWELERGKSVSQLGRAVLISAVLPAGSPMLGDRQREKQIEMQHDISREAYQAGVLFRPVIDAATAAEELLSIEFA